MVEGESFWKHLLYKFQPPRCEVLWQFHISRGQTFWSALSPITFHRVTALALTNPNQSQDLIFVFFPGLRDWVLLQYSSTAQYIIWATKPSPRSAWANLNPPPKSKLILLSQSCCLVSGVFEVGLWLHLSLNRRLQFDGRLWQRQISKNNLNSKPQNFFQTSLDLDFGLTRLSGYISFS